MSDPGTAVHVRHWDVENDEFWETYGKKIANRNLWISIPNLLLAFAIWIIWSIIAAQIQEVHDANPNAYAFGGLTGDAYSALLFTLPAVAGLSGATLRIPNSFMIAISGGRNVIAMTSLLLLLPTLGVGITLRDPNVSFTALVIFAVLSGVGGGAFASSMSNISFFFPKRVQGLSLGLNAGLGNVGVSIMQVLLPVVMTFSLFGALISGDAVEGVWITNAGLVWVPVLVIFILAAWFKMNNMPHHAPGTSAAAVGRYLWLQMMGFGGATLGTAALLLGWGDWFAQPIPNLLKIFLVLAVSVLTAMALMRYVTPKEIKENLLEQFQIFKSKHNWAMTWLYVMTFGSFIGFSGAFPLLIINTFNTIRADAAGAPLAEGAWFANPDPINAFAFAWLGPLVGSLIRPVGGWMSDKWGGARVTHWDTMAMIAVTIGVSIFIIFARSSPTPEQYFAPFLILFLLLFTTTGIGNGSTFRMVPIIFEREQAGPVLGWISAIAAYGAFLIPAIFGVTITAGVPEAAMWGFAVYYVTCLAVNWWFYARKNAEMPC